MIATFHPKKLCGTVSAPPSKSMAHRLLIGAALTGQTCVLQGVDFSEDVLATLDCLRALGAEIAIERDAVTVSGGLKARENAVLPCRESGSTLRFFIPLALCMGVQVTLCGSERLFCRPLNVYEALCEENGFAFEKTGNSVTLCGTLQSGTYRVRGDVSSQFISGLLFALVYLGGDCALEICPPFESRPYVDLTLSALRSFGANTAFVGENRIELKPSDLHPFCGKIEGDYSNAAFLDAFNFLGGQVRVENLNPHSLQGDRVYPEYFRRLSVGAPTLDLSDCPDLAPVLIALAALKNGATFTGTHRLREKESDRGAAMSAEIKKLGGNLVLGDDFITVVKEKLEDRGAVIDSHNDHRIVMAMSVILSETGGTIQGAEAISKSYPAFFEDLKKLGAEIELS